MNFSGISDRSAIGILLRLPLRFIPSSMVIEAAVSDREGSAQFVLAPDSHTGHLAEKPGDTVTARTVALDRLFSSGEILGPAVIKCDIEDGEYDALAESRQVLEKFAPTIFLATHGPEVYERCCRLLSSFGYELKVIGHVNPEEAGELIAGPKDR